MLGPKKKGEFFFQLCLCNCLLFSHKDLVLGVVDQHFLFVSNVTVIGSAYCSGVQLATETGESTVRRLCYKYATD